MKNGRKVDKMREVQLRIDGDDEFEDHDKNEDASGQK